MEREADTIDPARLLEATDAIYDAARELGLERLPPDPPALLGAAQQPAALCEFTRWEIEQATAFLVRLGELPPLRESKG